MSIDTNEIELRALLSSLGLTTSMCDVFIAIAKHPDSKTQDIQRYTQLVRTSIYYSLAQLKSLGLISESSQNNIRTYRVHDESHIRQKIQRSIAAEQEKLDQLTTVHGILEAMKTSPAQSSHMSRYEGVEPIKTAIDQALRCTSKKWRIIAPYDNFLRHMPKSYQQHYLNERERRGISARTLWERHTPSSPITLAAILSRSPRYLPDNFSGMFTSIVIIYDDSVLLIDSFEQQTAHIIHNSATAKLFALLFDSFWEQAQKAT